MSNECPVVSPPFCDREDGESRACSTVAGVVLAAGSSSRFGQQNKLLAEWAGAPIVVHAVRAVLQSRVDTVHVVVGDDAERIRTALDDLAVTVVYNDAADAGQSTSVRRGVEAARRSECDAILFALGDMPTVTPASHDRLIDAYAAGVGDPLAAACDGVRGNPVLFDRRHFAALADVTGDIGGRELLRTDDRARCVETGDPGVLFDIDCQTDLDEL